MFEVDTSRLERNSVELHSQLLKLNYYNAMLEELLMEMKKDELFEETQIVLKKKLDILDEERREMYGIVEGLYRISDRYKRCELKNIEETEGVNLKRALRDAKVIHINSGITEVLKFDMM